MELKLIGTHNGNNAAAAAAVGVALGFEPERILRGLANATTPGRRMRPVRLPGGALLIDDCYNANPTSTKAALLTLTHLVRGKGRAIAVLGGCASVEPCRSTPLDWMRLDCLESNCRNLIVVPSKLQRVIKAQQATVGKLRAVDETSVEYRIEAQTLQRLLDAQEKPIKPEAV